MAENEQAAPRAKKEETSIVRIAGRDINGNFKIATALLRIKGINQNLASAIELLAERKFGIERTAKIGALSEQKLAEIEQIIKDPAKFGVPMYMLNRRKDLATGKDLHMVGTDLIVQTRQDIEEMIKQQTWVGFRHQYGQKVRGQRTRSTGRTGATVGVTKKKILEAGKAAAAPAAPAAKKAA
ncbi:30S ribosomal protein S13 [uncultured archaeon]|nr:30S ribosomal protein S13 [uncultured archaeon]